MDRSRLSDCCNNFNKNHNDSHPGQSWWICEHCGKTKLGRFVGDGIEIRCGERIQYCVSLPVQAVCKNCKSLNILGEPKKGAA